jgi:spoIIIJ-associated protein
VTGPEDVSVEASGETVGEAKWNALRDLERLAPGLDEAAVRYQVVSEGERGLLGVGSSPARVVATASVAVREPRAVVQRDESEQAARVRGIVEQVADAIGVDTEVELVERDEEILATCTGGEVALLIGKHGQTIDALQYVANAALHRGGAAPKLVAAGYRDRRRTTLESIALRSAERAAAGERVLLEAMTAGERKVVHERLKEVEGVQTSSEGTEPNRYVVVAPA